MLKNLVLVWDNWAIFLMNTVIDLFQVWTWISAEQILGYQGIMIG